MKDESSPVVDPVPGKKARRAGESVRDPFYIQAAEPQADERTRVLKHGDTFAVFNHAGDIEPVGLGEEGLYHEGTRFLSCLVLEMGKGRPMFLSSTVKKENDVLAVDLTNPDMVNAEGVRLPRGTVHLFRTKFLWQGVCYERLRIKNYGMTPVAFSFVCRFAADFADIFEVRGSKRPRKGKRLETQIDDGRVVLAYEGLDKIVRRTRLIFTPAPVELSETEARFDVPLPPRQEVTAQLTVSCERGQEAPAVLSYEEAKAQATDALRQAQHQHCTVSTTNELFNTWQNRAVSDLLMMTTDTIEGPYPYAGVPWFSTAFGRDGLVTALECLWLNPALARGVLAYLAATQAHDVNPEQDAEPGKILHETRSGEMAALGEIPFGRYYGSVDSTPLFVLVAGAYFKRTGDRRLMESIWPNLELALEWMDTFGDPDHDGFIEYQRHSKQGLVQQGWKDSQDCIFHADGTLATGPIALCEVQGYAYAARLAAAELAQALGHEERAGQLREQSARLQKHFEEAFWVEELATYALALDGDKRPCRVRTSNAGQCLFTDIVCRERARRMARTLLSDESFSGWGIRTVSASEVRYNPMSYHNGSVWPHDNALIAYGLGRYGLKEPVLKVLQGLFSASLFVELHRLPELFCGFEQRPGEGPTLYPVACSPQAWSAAAVFMLLQAALGLEIDALHGRICFSYPVLPDFLEGVRINQLQVGPASVDLLLLRHGHDVGVNVLRREGLVEITMVK